MATRPSVFAIASAVGFYGDRGDTILDESSTAGQGYLATLCRDWEDAARAAKYAGIRVINFRFGVVLSRDGGMLRQVLPSFRLGFGATLGSGRQWMSWIAIDDLIEAVHFCVQNEQINGPVNIVAPNPVTNGGFTESLGSTLHRPAFLQVPAIVLRLIFGEMADEALLASTRAIPAKLLSAGFQFRHDTLESALSAILRKDSPA
jgi:uncharacterized protein (TIGR01777 family)